MIKRYFLAVVISWLASAVNAQADYRASTESKLATARQYADDFLKEDARPGQQFFTRTPKFPVWKDQPVIDCGMLAIMRAIQTKEPYFEDKKQKVVIVPVWVELLQLDVGQMTGYPFGQNEEGVVQCKFEYEQYSFKTKRFEKIPDLLKKPYIETFKNWGELAESDDKKRFSVIAIDLDKRYVKFKFRVSVMREMPYQLHPQFPRHHPVQASIYKLKSSYEEIEELIKKEHSDRDDKAIGEALQKDLVRMRWQNPERLWKIKKLSNQINSLQSIFSFSDIESQ